MSGIVANVDTVLAADSRQPVLSMDASTSDVQMCQILRREYGGFEIKFDRNKWFPRGISRNSKTNVQSIEQTGFSRERPPRSGGIEDSTIRFKTGHNLKTVADFSEPRLPEEYQAHRKSDSCTTIRKSRFQIFNIEH
jgi:hypothetical protein